MKITDDQFATVVRGLSLTPGQAAAADAVFASPSTQRTPDELIRREVLTEYQARMILDGRAAELTVGRYAILDELGGGGMGQVFKVRDTAMDRLVALKVIRADLLASESAVLRFQQEVRAAARLSHPNVVRAYDAGTADGKHYLVTELVSGHDLGRELARRGALPPGEACEFARQTAVGLQHALENGLTHRDIKPSNLLFSTAERVVKVTDFGLARLGGAGPNGLTAAGSMFGTPDYIAPEQAGSATAADIRSDIYSLGCTLYQFLTGYVPFPGGTAMTKLVAHATQEPVPLDEWCPGLNPALGAVVRTMMAKNPADRYQTPAEASDALARFCPKPRTGTTAFGVRPASSSAPELSSKPLSPATADLGSAATASEIPTTVPPERPAALKGRGPLFVAIGLLSVAVIALGAVVASQRSNQSVAVTITDWPRAREAGVTVYLNDKALADGEIAKPLALAPGHYTLRARKDGQDLEARAFEVTPDDDGKAVATRPAVFPDPAADPGEVRRWGAGGAVTDVVYLPDGKNFLTAEVPGGDPFPGADVSVRTGAAMYAAEGREVTARWQTLLAFRVAVVPRLNRAVALSFSDPPGLRLRPSGAPPDPYHFTSVDYRTGKPASQAATTVLGERVRIPLFLASRDGTRVLFTTTEREPTLKPSGEILVQTVKSTPTGALELDEPYRFPGDVACFDPTGPRVLAAKDKALVLHDEDTGKPLSGRYTGPAADVACVAMSEDGKRLAGGDAGGGVFVWAVGSQDPIAVGRAHAGRVNAVGFTLDGGRVVTAGEDGTVRVWDVRTAKEVAQFKHDDGKPVYALAISPGGKRVLTGGADKTIRLWQLPP